MSQATIQPERTWSDASYRVLKNGYTEALRSLTFMTEERNRLSDELDRVAGEALDAALNQDVLMDEVRYLTARLKLACIVAGLAVVLAAIGWLT